MTLLKVLKTALQTCTHLTNSTWHYIKCRNAKNIDKKIKSMCHYCMSSLWVKTMLPQLASNLWPFWFSVPSAGISIIIFCKQKGYCIYNLVINIFKIWFISQIIVLSKMATLWSYIVTYSDYCWWDSCFPHPFYLQWITL